MKYPPKLTSERQEEMSWRNVEIYERVGRGESRDVLAQEHGLNPGYIRYICSMQRIKMGGMPRPRGRPRALS